LVVCHLYGEHLKPLSQLIALLVRRHLFPKHIHFSVAVKNSLRTALCSRTAPNSKQTNKPGIGCLTMPNQHHLPMETKRQGVNIIKH